MLVLTRKTEETIRIGDDIVIKVTRIGNGTVKLGIEAPINVRVLRGELAAVEKPVAAPTVSLPGFGFGVLSDQFPHVA
ncbi:MAG: carbon storage regulator [Planctomycetaceae bacterium]|nr:carbon storage regulator [Planctomycetaceae bacterium]